MTKIKISELVSKQCCKALLCAAVASSSIAPSAHSDELDQSLNFNIPPQSLSAALVEFSEQAGIQLTVQTEAVAGLETEGVVGEQSARSALIKMLSQTGLTFKLVGTDTVAVSKADGGNSSGKSGLASMIAQAGASAESSQMSRGRINASAEYSLFEEIVVTATKREQSLQETPMSITALGYEDIKKRGLVSMQDYLSTVPGVSLIDQGVGRNAIVVRGVSADPTGEDSTVGIYFGEVPLTGLAVFGSADIKLVDIERIEVLRGPQGTLYGSSSLGGTVRNVPVAPDLEMFQGRVEAGYSELAGAGSDNRHIEGIVNLPLIENVLAIRASAYQYNNGGYIENIAGSDPEVSKLAADFGIPHLAVNEDDIGSSVYRGVRAGILYEPTEELSINLNYLTQELEQDGLPDVLLNGGYKQARLQLGVPVGGGEGLVDNIDIANLVVEYDLGWVSLLSSSSWIDEFSQRKHDLSWLFAGSDFRSPVSQFFDGDAKSFTEELRLTSQLDGPLQFIAGFYYEDVESVEDQDTFFVGADPAQNPLGEVVILNFDGTTTIKQKAFFGEVSYQFSPLLTLTAGSRFFRYDKTEERVATGPFGYDFTPIRGSESGDSFKLNVTLTPTVDTLFYAQLAEGFRLGKPQQKVPAAACDLNEDGIFDGTNASIETDGVDSDNLLSFEIGGKVTALEGQLTINGAIYRNNWEDIPVDVYGDCGLLLTLNAGEARTQGLEIESRLYVLDNVKLDVGFSYVDAEITTDVASLGAESGSRLPGSPRYNYNIALQYDFSMTGYPAFARIDYARVGGYYGNLQESGVELGDYGQLNLVSGITIDRFFVELFARNLTNADEFVWGGEPLAPTFNSRLRPRSIGAKVGFEF